MSRVLKGQKKVTTVWLDGEIGREGKDRLKMFFCFNCRVPLLQYSGNIMQIVPGSHPYTPSTLHKCKGNVKNEYREWEECGMYYTFMSTVYTMNYQVST